MGTRYLVIGSATQWARLWKEHDPNSLVPNVDFETHLMVCVFHPKWTKRGFRIDRIEPSFLGLSYTVSMKPRVESKSNPQRFAMASTARTRCSFDFVALTGGSGASSARVVARRSGLVQPELVASLRDATLGLLDEYAPVEGKADCERVLAKLTALGDPIRPFLQDIVSGRRMLSSGTPTELKVPRRDCCRIILPRSADK